MTLKTIVYRPDPKGFFYIYIDEAAGKIVVEHYKNVEKLVSGKKRVVSGKAHKIFKGTRATKLYRQVLANKLVSLIDHAAYLGMELAKAEIALRNKLNYDQDKNLELGMHGNRPSS